jgi:hypothetical protein
MGQPRNVRWEDYPPEQSPASQSLVTEKLCNVVSETIADQSHWVLLLLNNAAGEGSPQLKNRCFTKLDPLKPEAS